MIKFLKLLSDIVDPNYWASKISKKTGLEEKARNSKFSNLVFVDVKRPIINKCLLECERLCFLTKKGKIRNTNIQLQKVWIHLFQKCNYIVNICKIVIFSSILKFPITS